MITAGEVLRKKRESLGRSLETASQDTKIQKRFLEYIEHDDFGKFDSEVFLTGFIKIYSKYLNLDTEKLLALYRRSHPQQRNKFAKKQKKNKAFQNLSFGPKTWITIFSVIFFVAILGYIGIQIYNFQSPPQLAITSPNDNSTTDTPQLVVQGNTNSGAIVEINDTLVTLDSSGHFEKEITLNEGANIITIKARKNSSSIQEVVEVRKVTYTKPTQTVTETTPVPKTFTLTVEVKDAASWVKLDIDDKNIISQILQPSKKDYTINSKFYVITGKVNNTNIYVNGDQIPWGTNSTTGVAEITCTITNQILSCK